MNSVLIFLSIAIGVCICSDQFDFDKDWSNFKKNYGKSYADSEEESVKMNNWKSNKALVDKFNDDYASDKNTFTLGLNDFADMSRTDFQSMRLGRNARIESEIKKERSVDDHKINKRALPASLDWRSLGAVTPVKDQGNCGSCYAFSTAAALEGHYFLKTRKLFNFSSQQLLDCSSKSPYGNGGCNGGLEIYVYAYVKANGIMNQTDYPYVAKAGTCKYKSAKVVTKISQYYNYQYVSVDYLKNLLNNNGPITVGMYASDASFGFYKTGIYNCPSCPKTISSLDHAVLLVGYGTENGTDFWLLKNSWGTSWGEGGYFRIAQANNVCGILTDISYPQL